MQVVAVCGTFSSIICSPCAWRGELATMLCVVPLLEFALLPVQIYSSEGVKGFYRGCTTNLLRTTPAAALTFTSFELLSRQLKVGLAG